MALTPRGEIYFTATTQNYVMAKSADPDEKVNVVSFQWNWEFNYPDHRTPDGQPVRTVGSSSEIPLLVLPTEGGSAEYCGWIASQTARPDLK